MIERARAAAKDDVIGATLVKQLAAIDTKLAAIRLYVGTATIAVVVIALVVFAVAAGELTLTFDFS